MADELDKIIDQPSESQQRITKLSKDVKDQAEAKEAAELGKRQAEEKALELERERDFYAGFSDVVVNTPSAKEHKDDILAKVKSGYTIQDATFAVLGAAGKFNTAQRDESFAAGGSSATAIPNESTDKPLNEMSRDELRSELASRSDLVDILQPRSQR